MKIYFLTLILVLLVQHFTKVETNKDYKVRLFLSFFLIFLFGAFRATIGDGLTYEMEFNEVHQVNGIDNIINNNEHNEAGYQILSRIMPSFKLLELFIEVLVCFSLAFLFYRYIDPRFTWLAFLFLFLMGNNTIYFLFGTYRNAIGVCIMFLSVPLLLERRFIPYVILTLLASTFHTSMLFSMTLPLLVLLRKDFGKTDVMIWILVAILFAFANQSGLISFIEPYINQYFDRYDSVIESVQQGREYLGFLNILGSLTMLFLLISVYKNNAQEMDDRLFRLGLLYPLASLMGVLSARMMQCYAVFFIILLIETYKGGRTILQRLLIIFSLIYVSYDFYLFCTSEWTVSKHLIYHSIFGDF